MDNAVEALAEVRDAVQIQAAGLHQLCGGLNNQTTLLVQQSEMLNDILDLLTQEPDDESESLGAILKRLTAAIEAQAETLHRIEAAVTGRH